MPTLPFSRLPGMNDLFLDFIECPDKVKDFYPSRDQIPEKETSHRTELCNILLRQNEAIQNSSARPLVEKLAEPGTMAVLTGQQVGLLTGPMYTLWKALTALRFCEKMEKERGLRCVPVFWMATEDHNWHEIMNFAILRGDLEILPFSAKEHLFLSRQPTGGVSVSHPEVKKILVRAVAEIHNPQVQKMYSKETLSAAFARTLIWLLKDFPILIVDPSDPNVKRLAAPFFGKVVSRIDHLEDLLRKQNQTLRSFNYPVQVQMEEDFLPLFYLDGQERLRMRREELHETVPPEKLSPAALLRPLFQDFLFPTLAYVGGPAEIAYFAQLHPWYAAMEIEQPWLLARASLTLIPASTRSFLESRGLQPEELFIKQENLIDALINDTELSRIRQRIREAAESLKKHWERVKADAGTVDVTLKKSIETSERKIQYQLQKAEKKALSAVQRKNYLLFQQLAKARNVIYPGEKLQERYLNIFSFSTQLPELVQNVYERIDLDAKGHQWIYI